MYRSRSGDGRGGFWPAIAAFSFALIALGVIIYVTTDYGRVKIIVDGPKADVQVDGEQILVKTPRESITLRAGTHELAVKWRDGEYKTRGFVVHRGDNEECAPSMSRNIARTSHQYHPPSIRPPRRRRSRTRSA